MWAPMKNPRTLGEAERATYELIRTGHLTPPMAPLYRRTLAALAHAGLITRTPDGGFEAPAVLVDGTRAPSAPPPPPKPVLVNLNIRVPREVIEALDMLGENRSDVARAILAEALPRMLEARTAPSPAHKSGTHRAASSANGTSAIASR